MKKFQTKTAALHNLGCKVNSYETEAMQQLLEAAGYCIVDFSDVADVYVINTCSVTNMADRKSRQMIHRARKNNPEAIVVAAGCYVQTKTQEAVSDLDIDIVVGNNKKHELVQKINEFYIENGKTVDVVDLNDGQEYEDLTIIKTAEHTRAFIKIQDGCNQFCSYCIIPYARGRVRSRRSADILKEVKNLEQNGYKEIVLTGIHLSSFGKDTDEDLLTLIQEISKIEEIKRIRLGSLEPRVVTKEFVKTLARNEKICPHFHLSLQSGCDETLLRMNRKYTSAQFLESTKLLRHYFVHPAITTDVIVGFPQESEEEFLQTKAFLKQVEFFEMHIFKYSKREGTKAANMSGQVTEQDKSRRSALLLELEKEMSQKYRDYYLGKEVEILIEETVDINGKTYESGHTKEYIKVVVEDNKHRQNTLVRGRIEKRLEQGAYLLVEI